MLNTVTRPELILLMTSGLGLIVNFAVTLAGQSWARLTSQRYSAVLLPPAGLIITWSISSNLALSLGMIGALSIVRFRTPIKNPFELVVFFCYLIIGISSGVNPLYALWLTIVIILTPIVVAILDFPLKKARVFGKFVGSKAEFAEDPVQLLLQVRSASAEIPDSIARDSVSSISFQPSADEDGYVLDITASFSSLESAMSCLQEAQTAGNVLHGTVQVLER